MIPSLPCILVDLFLRWNNLYFPLLIQMIMEAMIESLKDLEKRHLQDSHSNVDTATSKSADDMESSTVESSGPGDTTGRSMSSGTSCSTVDAQPNQGSQGVEADRSTPTPNSDSAAGTRATLVIQKSPTNHVMEGLTRRWGLNFFKGNQ